MRTLPIPLLLLLLLCWGCQPDTPPAEDAAAEECALDEADAGEEDCAIEDLFGGRPDWVTDAVIYEVFVRDFSPEGTFRGIIPRLPELKALGVTTLWLMPIHPVGEQKKKGTLGSPYAVQDYFGVNPRFGTEDDFRALVEAVHAEDMKIIIDWVANHTAWDNAWMTEHPDWYTRSDTVIHPPDTDWYDVADLNYDNPEMRAEMIRALRYWVEEFDIDGYRCDVAGMVPLEFWEEAIPQLRLHKPVLMLAEHESAEIHEAGFDLTYAWDFYHKLKAVWQEGASVQTLAEQVAAQQAAYPVDALRLRFTTNHDETAWDAPPVQLFGGQDGARAASVIATLLPGVPLVYNGQEVGSEQQLPLFEKMDIDWDTHPEMRVFFTNLLAFHNESEAIRRGTIAFLGASEDVLMFRREAEAGAVFVAVNVRNRPASFELAAGDAGTDVLTGTRLTAGTITLPPFGYHVLVPE